MPLFFRKISASKWKLDGSERAWLARDDLAADPIGDLATTKNALSVFAIRPDRSNVGQVIAALAAAQFNPQKIEYVLVDSDALTAVGFEYEQSAGNTSDAEVNGWHYDIVKLSYKKLPDLVKLIGQYADGCEVAARREVIEVLRESLAGGRINEDKVAIRDIKTCQELGLAVYEKQKRSRVGGFRTRRYAPGQFTSPSHSPSPLCREGEDAQPTPRSMRWRGVGGEVLRYFRRTA